MQRGNTNTSDDQSMLVPITLHVSEEGHFTALKANWYNLQVTTHHNFQYRT